MWQKVAGHLALFLAALCAMLAVTPAPTDSTLIRGVRQMRARWVLATQWADVSQANTVVRQSKGDTIVVFIDYQCPYCRRADSILAVESHDRTIMTRQFPIRSAHPLAEQAARIAICAGEEGVFKQWHDFLIETQEWQLSGDPIKDGGEAGLPGVLKMQSCVFSATTTAQLAEDEHMARALGVRGTPAFVTKRGVTYQVEALLER